jgi:hypothetical protein
MTDILILILIGVAVIVAVFLLSTAPGTFVYEPRFSFGLSEPPMSSCCKNHFPRQLAGRFCRNASMPSAASSKRRLHAITSLATS